MPLRPHRIRKKAPEGQVTLTISRRVGFSKRSPGALRLSSSYRSCEPLFAARQSELARVGLNPSAPCRVLSEASLERVVSGELKVAHCPIGSPRGPRSPLDRH